MDEKLQKEKAEGSPKKETKSTIDLLSNNPYNKQIETEVKAIQNLK